MYQVETNFGSYNLRLMPTTEDILKYYHLARSKGMAIEDIKFRIVEPDAPSFDSICTILRNIK
jgi:hypothetical protein